MSTPSSVVARTTLPLSKRIEKHTSVLQFLFDIMSTRVVLTLEFFLSFSLYAAWSMNGAEL